MSLVKAEEDLKKKGMLDRVIHLAASTATTTAPETHRGRTGEDRRSHGLGGCVQIKRIQILFKIMNFRLCYA